MPTISACQPQTISRLAFSNVGKLSAVTGILFSRSRQPRWRDTSGQEVVTRVDLGRLSFFRGDRNWLILTTHGEPVFLSVENTQIQPVIVALQARPD